jgi:hypothetical protein
MVVKHVLILFLVLFHTQCVQVLRISGVCQDMPDERAGQPHAPDAHGGQGLWWVSGLWVLVSSSSWCRLQPRELRQVVLF